MRLQTVFLTALTATAGTVLGANSASAAFIVNIDGSFSSGPFSTTLNETVSFADSVRDDFLTSVSDNDSSLPLSLFLPSLNNLVASFSLPIPPLTASDVLALSGTGSVAISSGSNVGFSFSLVPIDPVLGVPVAEFLFTDSIAACATIACNWSSNNLFALARFGSTFFLLPPSSFAFTTTPQAVPEPLTLLGTAAALGSGLLMRKRSAQ